jgi:hypothetical protein
MKKILAVVLLTILLLSLISCGPAASGTIVECAKEVDDQYVNFEIVEHDSRGGWTVLYDKNTKVMYLILDGYQSTGMTPILNADGTPKLYEGD